MNFPGLELAWNGWHGALRKAGVIRTWDLEECRVAMGDGVKVLVCATTALGDSLLATPLVETLADHLGKDRVGFVVKKPFVELYEEGGSARKVYGAAGKFRGHGRLRRELRRGGYRIALIANCTEPDFVPMLWQSGVRGFLRYPTRWSRWHEWFANQRMMRPPEDPGYATGHAIENNLAMAEALGLKRTTERMAVKVEKEAKSPALPQVLVHPGASTEAKCWPLGHWAEVARALHAEMACEFVVTGGANEREIAEKLARILPGKTVNRAGELSLKGLAKVQASAALFLSGDTGPYHLAVAVGCPTVTLFAPRDRGSSVEACGPHKAPGEHHAAIQTKGFNEGIQSIAIEPVLAAAKRVRRIF